MRERFDALAYSARKEHVRSVEDAKQAETRQRRVTKIIEKLRLTEGQASSVSSFSDTELMQ